MSAVKRINPYSRPHVLAKLDGRTREAKLMAETRAALIAHVGGNPSAVQAVMIEQAVQLRLRIATMDRRFAETGQQTEHDSRTYLSWVGSLARVLSRLGLQAVTARQPDIRDLLAGRAAGTGQARP
jgi:hypothetical protein